MRRLLELDERISVVGEAGSAEQALDQMDRRPAEVLLMDIQLPGMDGIEATRQLRTRHPGLKVLVLSSFGEQYLAKAIDAGATGYLLKTATQPELAQAVVLAASGHSLIDPALVPKLLEQVAELSKMVRGEALTTRQKELLRLIGDGVHSTEIAETLSMSHATLTRELRRIFNALGVDDRAHAVAEAYRRNIL